MPTDQFGNVIYSGALPPSPLAQSLLANKGKGRDGRVRTPWKRWTLRGGGLTDDAQHLHTEIQNLSPGWKVEYEAEYDTKPIVTAYLLTDEEWSRRHGQPAAPDPNLGRTLRPMAPATIEDE